MCWLFFERSKKEKKRKGKKGKRKERTLVLSSIRASRAACERIASRFAAGCRGSKTLSSSFRLLSLKKLARRMHCLAHVCVTQSCGIDGIWLFRDDLQGKQLISRHWISSRSWQVDLIQSTIVARFSFSWIPLVKDGWFRWVPITITE